MKREHFEWESGRGGLKFSKSREMGGDVKTTSKKHRESTPGQKVPKHAKRATRKQFKEIHTSITSI